MSNHESEFDPYYRSKIREEVQSEKRARRIRNIILGLVIVGATFAPGITRCTFDVLKVEQDKIEASNYLP